jgi:hypothetical protein
MNDAPSGQAWIRSRIEQAKAGSPPLAADMLAKLEAFLAGDLAQQHLASNRIAEIADALLAEATPRASQ